MQIKILKGLYLHITTDRIIGYAVMLFSLNAAIYHALFIEGSAGGFGSFLHWPTSLSVLAIGLSMTYMKKHTIKSNELGILLRENLILSGWLVFMVTLILSAREMHNGDYVELANVGSVLVKLVLCVQYGYVYGIIFEAFFTKDVTKEP